MCHNRIADAWGAILPSRHYETFRTYISVKFNPVLEARKASMKFRTLFTFVADELYVFKENHSKFFWTKIYFCPHRRRVKTQS